MTWLLAAAGALLIMLLLWLEQQRSHNAATADVGWALLVAGGTALAALTSAGDPWRRALVAALVILWATRLGWHLLRDRVWRAEREDGRYHTLREHWGSHAGRGFLALYLAQVVVAAAFVAPAAAAMRGGALDSWDLAGVVIWSLSVLLEWQADRQLARFRADSPAHNTVCRIGWWRYSRHPNYFFEWLHWWSYVLVGHAALLTLLGPAAMLLFLFRITGIPWTEKQAIRSRGDAYRAYQSTTSVFVPWPPRGGRQ